MDPSDDGDELYLRDLGKRIRELRVACSLSQEELAHRAGIHRTYVSSVERGQRNIAVLNILRLARILGVEPGGLLPPTPAPAEKPSVGKAPKRARRGAKA